LNNHLSVTVLDLIDEVCDRFERAWKNDSPPRVDDYLDGMAGSELEYLRRELLRVDHHYRRPENHRKTQPDKPFVGGYEVLRELGRGGMGVVYLARQIRPNRLVALKMISAGVHADTRNRERFRSEADAIAQLQHPHIVQVYEVGEQDGCPFFALEYVSGGSLDQYLKGAPQPPRAAAQLVKQLAHAIHHAHQRGIIHRDLKPANILLHKSEIIGQNSEIRDQKSEDGTRFISESLSPLTSDLCPKITDFGLAKLLDVEGGDPTRSGDVLGTPGYMAPEQVGGSQIEISAATDVYGLGAILYELLTGRPPFRGENAVDTMLQVRTVEPVSPSRMQPKCPRDLVTICLKCLHKLPYHRYCTAAELGEDLRRFLDGQPICAQRTGPLRQLAKWVRRQPMVAGLSGLLLLAVISGIATGSWFWWRAAEGWATAETALGKERAAHAARIETLDRYQVALAHREWQANNVGRAFHLLNACTDQRRQTWEWRYLDRLRRSPLHTFAGHKNTVQSVAMHPSRPQIASGSHDWSVRLWDLETGQGVVIGQHRGLVWSVAYSPDGRMLASSGARDGRIKIWDATTGAELQSFRFGGSGEVTVRSVAFDPTSRYLAVGGPKRVKIWDTQEKKWIYNKEVDTAEIYRVAFSPDPNVRQLATASRRVKVWDWASEVDSPKYDWAGHGSWTVGLAYSPNGKLLASGGRNGSVSVHNLQTGDEVLGLYAHQLSLTSLAFSPDSKRLATAGQDGDMHIWSLSNRNRLFTLHGHSGAVWDLVYSPKSHQLVSAGSDFLVRVWDASTSQEVETLPFRGSNEIRALNYDPSGRLLAWTDRSGRAGVGDTVTGKVVLQRDNSKLDRQDYISSFIFSPSGNQLAWRRMNGAVTLWDLEKDTEVPVLSRAQGKYLGLAYTYDGKQLLATTFEKEKLQIHDLLSGQSLLAIPMPNNFIAQVAWSPGARRLVTVEDKKYVRVWDAQTGQLLYKLEHQISVSHVACSADGRFIAVGGVGGKMDVWDLTTKSKTMSKTGHASNLYGLALSPDGRRLASAASDCTIRLWDTQTGDEVLTLRGQLHEHSPLAFSPDGADLASTNMNYQIQIWSTRDSARKR